jgi:hypothetical protein
MFLYLAALFPSLLLSLYIGKRIKYYRAASFILIWAIYGKLGHYCVSLYIGKKTYLILFRQNLANLDVLFFLYIGKKEHFYISPPYLILFGQTWFIFIHVVIFSLWKKTLFRLIWAKFDKLGRAAALFSLSYLIFGQLYCYFSYRGKDNLFVFILFSVGENTIFDKIYLNFDV